MSTLKIDSNEFNEDISKYENELRNLGYSDSEIQGLNNQLDGIIERGFDKYFSKLYE